MKKYELIVIGTGPAGEKAAVKAAYFGHSVAIIEKGDLFGGAEVVTGTLPSKTLRETALFFSGKYEKGLYSIDRNLQHRASIDDFMYRRKLVTTKEADEIHVNLMRHGVDIYYGTASFATAHVIDIAGKTPASIYGDTILIATGSYPYHPPQIPFDNKRVHDSDTILQIDRFPSSLCIVGGGVISCEYATIFATMGVKVYLVNDKESLLPFVDKEVTQELVSQMTNSGIKIYFNTKIESVTAEDKKPVQATLATGEILAVDMFLYATGRSGNTRDLHCEKIGLTTDKREQLAVDKSYRTAVPNVYAVGDVIGFPALASTSMDQGRVAVAHIFQTEDLTTLPHYFPYGIYTIPEISMVGLTEEQVKEQQIPYCVGKTRYTDLARGRIMGASGGFLKLILKKSDLTIIGVHIIGHIASELIHYGVELVENQKNLYYLIGRIFNYPTLHDLYKYAAYDGLSNLSGHKIKP